LHGTIRY